MTYSNNRHQTRHQSGFLSPSPFNTNPAQTNEAYFAALAPAFRVVVTLGLAMLAMILFMIALKGSREDKTEFLNRMFERLYAKRTARLKELRAEYIVWRQRKCWMWGGGFLASALAILPNVFVAANDQTSFDALIPD